MAGPNGPTLTLLFSMAWTPTPNGPPEPAPRPRCWARAEPAEPRTRARVNGNANEVTRIMPAMVSSASGLPTFLAVDFFRDRGSQDSQIEDLARVEDVVRVKGPLQGAHERDLGRAARIGEVLLLDQADAVLGRDAAAEALDQLEHRVVRLSGQAEELVAAHPVRFHHIDVDVAVPDMAEETDLP